MFFRYNWPGFLWILLIFVITGLPGDYVPAYLSFLEWLSPDKWVHIILFGVLSFLLLRGLRKQYQFPGLRYHYVHYTLLFGIILGLITEVMQVFVFTGRNGNVFDFAANTMGCFAGWGAYRLFNRKLRHKK